MHKGFPFSAAAALAPYLRGLGISHVYLSPISQARAGSTHGYDVVDHTRLNPELGTEADFRAMALAFRAHGLGILLDIVPNHMAVGGADNPMWLDVLEHGEASRFAPWFDIDWHSAAPGLDERLLVPFLGTSYEKALQGGDLELRFDPEDGKFAIWAYGTHKLPLAPETAATLRPDDVGRLNTDKAALESLIGRQHWRLAHHLDGDREINYRRFFTIADLAGIRVERPEVFDYVHRLPLTLVEEGLVDGLRIDHIDGLYDPADYCRKLRAAAPRPIYVVVEKILAAEEEVRADWGVEGTTGYEFASLVTPLLVDPAGEAELIPFHREFTGVTETAPALEQEAKLGIMDHELAAELDATSRRFARLAAAQGQLIRDDAMKLALRAFVASMPVYRTYASAAGTTAEDLAVIGTAMLRARQFCPVADAEALAFVASVLTGERSSPEALDIAMRLQQFTGPVMAKGLEDTALYRDNRLIALNDVGERPEPFSIYAATVHAAIAARRAAAPHSLLGSTTHDSKRGEDARCRIAALSGHAAEWTAAVPRWLATLHEAGAPDIHPGDAYHFLQLLLGAWPGSMNPDLADRLVGAMRKSLREARWRSSWSKPDEAYEARVEAFVRLALDPGRGGGFLADMAAFEPTIGFEGMLNGLVETVLKLTLPGVPDIYQGAELWEQSLVDPDNRRPVDFSRRAELLDAHAADPLEALLPSWRTGAIKQQVVARLLAVRATHPSLFDLGSYEPISVADHQLAFLRRHGGKALFVIVRLHPATKGEALRSPNEVPGPVTSTGWQNALGTDLAGPLPFCVFLA